MLIFGHKLLKTQDFVWFEEEIFNDKIHCFSYNEEKIKTLKDKNLHFSILIQDKNEIFLSAALGAQYLLFKDVELAKFASKSAEFYLFDTKILLIVENFNQLEQAYFIGVDGVILKNYIKNFH